MRDELIAALKRDPYDGSQSAGGTVSHDLAGLAPNSPMLQLQGQLEAEQAEEEMTNRQQAIASLRISDYQSRLNEEPATRAEADRFDSRLRSIQSKLR